MFGASQLRRFDLGNKAIEGIFDRSLVGAIGKQTASIRVPYYKYSFLKKRRCQPVAVRDSDMTFIKSLRMRCTNELRHHVCIVIRHYICCWFE